MQEFILEKFNNNLYQYLVFGTTVESPLFQLQKIAKKLKGNNCTVLFDQLLQTGNTDNRFLTIAFKKNSFDLSTVKNIDGKNVDENTRKVISDFLRSNELLLKYCILVSAQKEVIKNGGII
ncbi:MAG: type II toxin-antitoxin system RnlB family antitoxin [Clostridia bacterium]|nr:type II toxin-antitoxin system RnlB family antitoxin [Clostridia bacterium]